jgi:hypothetical protein
MLTLICQRRLIATVLALTLVLSSATQVFASIAMAQCASMSMSDSMAMPDMQDDAIPMVDHGKPCTDAGMDCVWAAGCVTAFAAPASQGLVFAIVHRGDKVEISVISGSSRSIPPALPPPITLA